MNTETVCRDLEARAVFTRIRFDNGLITVTLYFSVRLHAKKTHYAKNADPYRRLYSCSVIRGLRRVGRRGGPTFPFTGVYSGALTAGGGQATIVVSIDGSGVTDAVLANSTGVLLSGSGTTTTAGQITVAMVGSAGPTTLTGNFPLALTRAASSGPSLDLSGGVNSSGIPTSKEGATSLYKGKYSIQYTGSASGGFKVNISSAGKVYLIEGSNQTLIGSVGPTGSIAFEGPGLVVPSTTETVWTGKLFVSPSSSGGSGTFEQKSNPGFSGSWGAVPEAPITPIFNQTSIVQGLRPSDSITILATSPNGHMVGFSDSKATFWETPDAAPVELSNPGSTTITWMTSVNSAGAKVGYSYIASGGEWVTVFRYIGRQTRRPRSCSHCLTSTSLVSQVGSTMEVTSSALGRKS